jgi:serine/threonine protein kinase/Flp pilus assembly protein TadD
MNSTNEYARLPPTVVLNLPEAYADESGENWRQTLLASLLDADKLAELEHAARAYGEFRRNHQQANAARISAWCATYSGNPEPAALFRDLHMAEPEVAGSVAGALSNLPGLGRDFLGFRLVAELGRGAFARVYLAEQGDLANRYVALKVCADIFGESQKLAQLQHSNIVPIYSIHRAGSLQAACMPYFGSTTLADVLQQVQQCRTLPESGEIVVSTVNHRKSITSLQCSSIETPVAAHLQTPPLDSGPALPTVPPSVKSAVNLKLLRQLSYVEAVLWMTARVADGLAHAHERGILHRDLKPANILLTDEGQVMLLDFNLSEDTKRQTSAARASIGGTLPYMSPEQFRAFRKEPAKVDERSDLYSVGVVLHELLTGELPHPLYSKCDAAALGQMLQDRLVVAANVRRLNRAISPAIAAIVHQCLQPEPARRYQSARALHEDIERQLQNLPLKHVREPSLRERVRKLFRRNPRLAPTAVLLAASMLIVLLSAALHNREKRLERLQATETFASFQTDLNDAQAILFSRDADREHLAQGIDIGKRTLSHYRVLENPAWGDRQDVRSLSGEDQLLLRQEAGELLALLSKAERVRAEFHNSDDERAEGFKQALALNDAALTCFDENRTPRALFEERGVLARFLGQDDQEWQTRARAAALTASDSYLLAHDHALRGRFRDALVLLRQATQTQPQNYFAWHLRGVCYLELLQDNDAIGCFNACIALRPAFYKAWLNRGLGHKHLGNLTQAEADFSRALELDRGCTDALVNKAMVYEEQGKFQEAVAALTEARTLGSERPDIYLLRADARARAGDKEGARQDFERGLEVKPTDEQGWLARGRARIERDPKGALADFEEAIRLNPLSFEGLQNKAAILSDQFKDDAAALKVLNREVELYPESVLALGGRGVSLARAGRRAEALQDAEKALSIDAGPPTLYQVACIYALTSQSDPADRDKAYPLLAAALGHGFGFQWVDEDKDLDPIRKQPEFVRLIEAARALRGVGKKTETRM